MRYLLLCLLVGASGPLYAKVFIHAQTLIDGRSQQTRENVTVIVQGDKIEGIAAGFLPPGKDDQVIDLRDSTLMPGLMDMHVHLSTEFHGKSYLERYTAQTADYALRAALHAERTVMAGFTTVRDLGDTDNVTISLRSMIDRGLMRGPRIFAAGKSIATTGGHADPTNGARRGLFPDPTPLQGVINGPDEARQAVRQRYKDGSDLIKITATGGVLSEARSGQNAQFTDEELTAIMATARDYGFTVAAHAHGTEGMKRAVRAGVDSIEHGTYMTDEVMELMKKKGTYFVPTMIAGAWVAEKSKIPDFFPEVVRVKAATIGPKIADTFAKALRSGVKIAFGTDCGVSEHGRNAEEFSLMVKAGMKPMAAIQAATWHAAQLLRVEDRLGSIEAGKLADLVAVPGNPLRDIGQMQKVHFVMQGGRVLKQASPDPSSSGSKS